jgi:hypothetical protein
MKAAMLRDWQTVNQAGLSPQEIHCHQYFGMREEFSLLRQRRQDV